MISARELFLFHVYVFVVAALATAVVCFAVNRFVRNLDRGQAHLLKALSLAIDVMREQQEVVLTGVVTAVENFGREPGFQLPPEVSTASSPKSCSHPECSHPERAPEGPR